MVWPCNRANDGRRDGGLGGRANNRRNGRRDGRPDGRSDGAVPTAFENRHVTWRVRGGFQRYNQCNN